jgi:hypothetical protein
MAPAEMIRLFVKYCKDNGRNVMEEVAPLMPSFASHFPSVLNSFKAGACYPESFHILDKIFKVYDKQIKFDDNSRTTMKRLMNNMVVPGLMFTECAQEAKCENILRIGKLKFNFTYSQTRTCIKFSVGFVLL